MSDTEPMDLSLLAEVVALRATLARVEALAELWETDVASWDSRQLKRDDDYERTVYPRVSERGRCARLTRAALAEDARDDAAPGGGEPDA